MITTNKNINILQLDKELGSFGLIFDFNDSQNKIIGVSDNSPVNLEELQNAINQHKAIDDKAEATVRKEAAQAKLVALGLDLDDLRALGL